MSEFEFHDLESAPSGSRPLLEAATRSLGFTPSLYAGLAESPTALKVYLDAAAAFGKSSLGAPEQQVVLLATSVENGCEFCVAAHSFIARNMVKLPSTLVDALRAGGALPDARLDALASFTRAVVRDRGWVSPDVLAATLAAGFSRAQILDVIVGVSVKTLSNYANHLLGTPLNAQFASEAWRRTPVA